MTTPIAEFSVLEPLGVAWQDQLLCRRVTFSRAVNLARLSLYADSSEGTHGAEVPFQATDVVPGRGGTRAATLWFWCDLEAGERRNYQLRSSRRAPSSPVVTAALVYPTPGQVEKAELVLKSRHLRLRLPGSRDYRKPVPAARVPGPLTGFSRPGQPWFGGSHWESRLNCTAIATEILAGGPLWTEARVHYAFEHGASYAMMVRLYQDRDYAVVDEQIATRIDGRLVLELSRGWAPDRFYVRNTCSALENDGHSTVAPLPPPGDRLREIQVPAIGTYYVPHLTGYAGLFEAGQQDRGLLGIVGLDGAQWESAIHNRLRMARRTDGEVVLEMPAKAGRRRWGLMMTNVAPAIVTGAHQQSPLLALQIRQSQTRLQDVLAMQLTAPATAAPLFFTEALVHRARTRLAAVPEFADHLAAVQSGAVAEPAFGYLMTGQRSYAEAARAEILQGLLGMRDRTLQGGTTDANASTIILSRNLRQWALILDLLRLEPDLMENTQGREIERLFLFFAHKMMAGDSWPFRRVALHQDHPEAQKPLYGFPGEVPPDVPYWSNCLPNFQSDWLTALATIGLLYPTHPQAPDWVAAGVQDLDAQLDAFVFPTGAWVESMNYALFTLNYFTQFFLMLQHAGGRNFFADERLLRWLHWHTRMLTPPDPRIGGLHTQAYVGNAILPDGQAAVFNWLARLIPDRELAGRLIEIWRREGAPAFAHPGPRLVESLLDPDQPAGILPLFGSTLEPGFGALLRHDEGTRFETFLTFKVGVIFSHYEGDELSFHWHARGVPLCSDYGVYQGPSGEWSAHNVVEVPALDSIRRGFLTDHQLDASADYLVGEHPGLIRYYEDFPESFRDPDTPRFAQKYNYLDHEAPLGPKVWRRRALLFVKPHYLVLLDDVDGVTPSRFNLHCVADKVRLRADRLEYAGRFGMDLSVFVAEPASFTIETGRHAPQRGTTDHSQCFARLQPATPNLGQASQQYRTVLYPHTPTESVSFRRLEDGVGVEVDGPAGRDRVWLARETLVCDGPDYSFTGSVAFTRLAPTRELHLLRGRHLRVEDLAIEGEGPIHVECHPDGRLTVRTDGPARRITVTRAGARLKVLETTPGVTVTAQGAGLVADIAPGEQSLRVKSQ